MKVTGIIQDVDKIPFDQAHVYLLNNKAKGTYTNFDGYFALDNVNAGDVLVFSHVESGQALQRTIAATDGYLDITLNRNIELDGITLTAKQKKNYWFLYAIIAFGIYKVATKKEPKKITI